VYSLVGWLLVKKKHMKSLNNTIAMMIMRCTWRTVRDDIYFANVLGSAKSAVCIAVASFLFPVYQLKLVSMNHVTECDERYVRY